MSHVSEGHCWEDEQEPCTVLCKDNATWTISSQTVPETKMLVENENCTLFLRLFISNSSFLYLIRATPLLQVYNYHKDDL